MSIQEPEFNSNTGEFRLRLQAELVRRMKANPRYSLRAFARALNMDPSTLSQFLRGKRKLSPKQVETLAMKIGLTPEEVAGFVKKSSAGAKPSEESWKDENRDLTLDVFQVIADWYHYAIFEMATLKEFKRDSRWIAKKLGITPSEAQFAVERLLRIGLLEENEAGVLKQGPMNISTTGNPFTAVAFRKLQAQILQQAVTAMEEIPIEKRDQSSMTMAINASQLDEAKTRIRQFRRELCDYLQKDTDNRDAVYHLSVSFYPVTKD